MTSLSLPDRPAAASLRERKERKRKREKTSYNAKTPNITASCRSTSKKKTSSSMISDAILH
jgi:hypothetical protein